MAYVWHPCCCLQAYPGCGLMSQAKGYLQADLGYDWALQAKSRVQ